MDDNTILGLILFFPMLVGILGVGAWTRFRWLKLKPTLFPEAEEVPSASDSPAVERRHRFNNVPALLEELLGVLERDSTPEAQVLLKAAHTLESSTPQFAEAIQSLLINSMETAEVRSFLIRTGGSYAYIVVVPNRHEHPHLIRRHEFFSAGWAHHANLVKASLIASGPFDFLIGYLFFISPDAKEGVLLVSYTNGRRMIVPSTLIQEAEMKLGEVSPLGAALEFKLSN